MTERDIYKSLKEENEKLRHEVALLRSGSSPADDFTREMALKAFHRAPQLMAISNLDTGVYIDVNEAFLRTLGYTEQEIIGHTSDDIHVFADIEQSNKYIRLLSNFRKVTDFPVKLKMKSGECSSFLFSAESIQISGDHYLLTTYNHVTPLSDKGLKTTTELTLNEIFETVTTYLLLVSVGDKNHFFIRDINSKAEDIEFIVRQDMLGRDILETPLVRRVKLIELLHHIRITGEPHKLSTSVNGDDSEGYYMGFLLSSGDIVITWEPGRQANAEGNGMGSDFSVLRRHEEQIAREKAFLEHLIDSTPEAIVITDIPGKITLINKEFTNLFGYTYDEAINKYLDDLIVPEELKEEAMLLDDPAKHSKREIQTVRRDKAGNNIQVSLIASNIVISDVTVALLGIYRDVTSERKNQQLQEILYNISNAALQQMDIKEIYPTIVSELSKIWDTNNFYIALYDKSSHTLSLPFFADEKDDFNEIPAKGTITGWVIKNNRPVLLKEDDLRRIEEAGEIDLVGTPCKVWMGVPLRVDGEIIGVMCLQDYHLEDKFSNDDLNVLDFIANQIALAIQRRTMLDNLISARMKAEEAAQSKQLFMSTMSHEIRTPLNEVIGISNLLMQSNPTEDQSELIKTLRFSANHLMTLVNDVLDYNKMESGRIVFEQSQFNLSDFLEEIKRSYSFRANDKKLHFDIIKSPEMPSEVIGDQIRLNQILSNLISNALKFTLEGSIHVIVKEIERSGNQSKIGFTVRDTGIGIPSEKHSEIFESFTQASTDTTRKFGGTGLGLAICKKLVELQGGAITLSSATGKGSSFYFHLFFGIADQKELQRGPRQQESYKGLEGKRILVAEDNKINFFVANKFLAGWGVNVTHVENGQLALEMLSKQEFDLVLMDLHMPILDGIEASRIIRNSKDPRIAEIPIVALTAAIMSESHDRIEGLNINDYVLKPFKPQDLFDRILKHVR